MACVRICTYENKNIFLDQTVLLEYVKIGLRREFRERAAVIQ